MSEQETLDSLRKELHTLRGELTMAKYQVAHLEAKLAGTPLYDHWTTWNAPRVSLDQNGKPYAWHITLSEYERSNLLWLMCDVIGYPYGRGMEPFNLANTGDWNGTIPNMLRGDHSAPTEHVPNKTVIDLKDQVEQWRKDGR